MASTRDVWSAGSGCGDFCCASHDYSAGVLCERLSAPTPYAPAPGNCQDTYDRTFHLRPWNEFRGP